MVYLDNAATTLTSEASIREAARVLAEVPGNPSSLYDMGLYASRQLGESRKTVASALGCRPEEVVFCAGGTEANNLAVLGAARARRAWANEIVITGYEHPAVFHAAHALQAEGFTLKIVDPARDGIVDITEILDAVGKKTALVACMQVNSETGAVLDVAELASRVKDVNRRTAFHTDAVQGFLKHPLRLEGAVDTAAISGHKVHAPKGIGALYVRQRFHLDAVLHGGGQERGLRSGTENVAFAAAFAKAVEEWGALRPATQIEALNRRLREGLGSLDGAVVHSPPNASPYLLMFSLPGYKSEPVLHFLAQRGIYLSSGSACGRGKSSHTLTAMALDHALIDSALRVGFTAGNVPQDVDALLEGLREAQKNLVRTGK